MMIMELCKYEYDREIGDDRSSTRLSARCRVDAEGEVGRELERYVRGA